jgi:hypothetical protein
MRKQDHDQKKDLDELSKKYDDLRIRDAKREKEI